MVQYSGLKFHKLEIVIKMLMYNLRSLSYIYFPLNVFGKYFTKVTPTSSTFAATDLRKEK